MLCKPFFNRAGATSLPFVTVEKNTVVAAGAVVNKDVTANTVGAGMPAKLIKEITTGGS